MTLSSVVKDFRAEMAQLSREELLEKVKEQDINLFKEIRRIEWVFANKLRHIGITERQLTNEELALILDPPFKEDPVLTQAGFTLAQQKQAFISSDPVMWARHFLNARPRAYQILMLRDPSLRRVWRLGRRAGKTYTLAILLLHYAYTTTNGRCLIMAPMKSHVQLIYQEVITLARGDDGKGIVYQSITRHITSPQFEIYLSNGSTMRFFTTGMKSGGKSDVARGQEAHIIVLDEMDYMGQDDLDALYAMLQQTKDNQPDKIMIGSSTPTGRRERFWEWCHGIGPDGQRVPDEQRFSESYFPSYCNPHFKKENEQEFRANYNEMAYRHEIEADWGEDAEGVYPRRFVDKAFISPPWKYIPRRTVNNSTYLMGVDWDKYGAGPNIVVLEVCEVDHPDPRFAGRMRVAFREEIPRQEFVYIEAIKRVIELNAAFNPAYIYVDAGSGEMQYEELVKHGMDHPHTMLRDRVKRVSFAQSIEVKDPATHQPIKKDVKPFMVDNFRMLLENEAIVFPEDDEELYMQLISYIIARTTSLGRPIFEASGSQQDHAHDALILACLAYIQNYGDLFKLKVARMSKSFSGEILSTQDDPPAKGGGQKSLIRPNWRTRSSIKGKTSGRISRKMF